MLFEFVIAASVALAAICLVLTIWLLLIVRGQTAIIARVADAADAQTSLGTRLEQIEARQREDSESRRRQFTELDQGLRKEISAGMKESLEAAFARVQEVTAAIGGLTKLMAEKLADAEKAAVQGRANLLRDTSESIVRGGDAVRTNLTEFRAEVSQRLDAVSTTARDVLTQLTEKMTLGFDGFSQRLRDEQELLRGLVGAKLEEMRASNETKLEQMRKAVDEQLQTALEKRIGESFTRVAEQFAQVQQAIGQVQAVTTQIGDIKRLFSNVKARGGWGEAQIGQLLDDILPAGAYETNVKLGDGAEMVEFALRMPHNGNDDEAVWLAIDAKFPTEDYDRLVQAAEAGDRDGETEARRSLERAIKEQARRIAKYICPPRTLDYAVMYLPTEGLFHTVERTPGLVEAVRREHSVYIMSPSLLPALLQMIRVGHLTLALEQKADVIRDTLGAVKFEWEKMNGVLDTLGKRAQRLVGDIDATRTRTRAVGRVLKNVDVVTFDRAESLLGVGAGPALITGPEEELEEEPALGASGN
jgi:DNA recombination protein RmuC